MKQSLLQIYLLVSVLCCVSCLPSINPCEEVAQGLDTFKGKHIDDLINVIGYPEHQTNIAKKRLYVWTHKKSITRYRDIESITDSLKTTTTTIPVNEIQECTIKVEVDRSDIILSSHLDGDYGGCYKFLKLFNQHGILNDVD